MLFRFSLSSRWFSTRLVSCEVLISLSEVLSLESVLFLVQSILLSTEILLNPSCIYEVVQSGGGLMMLVNTSQFNLCQGLD
jgi:hypothetical protein